MHDDLHLENKSVQIESGEEIQQQSIVPETPNSVKGIDSPYRYDCNEVKCTALDEYVWRDNEHFAYEQVAEYGSLVGPRPVKTFVMNMTSQHWLTEAEVDRTEWYHELVITLPKEVDKDLASSCLFLIDKGSNKPNRIIKEDSLTVTESQKMALASGTCVAVLRQVPNQRLYMKNDPRLGEKGRSEDDLIAWTWKHFVLYPNQPDWLLRMPMTKAVRLAFDLVDIKIQEEKNRLGSVWKDQFETVDKFTVLGRSKRGWTTWTIASVDKRVKAAIPIVLDCVNMDQTFRFSF